jgi:hypothetical protein
MYQPPPRGGNQGSMGGPPSFGSGPPGGAPPSFNSGAPRGTPPNFGSAPSRGAPPSFGSGPPGGAPPRGSMGPPGGAPPRGSMGPPGGAPPRGSLGPPGGAPPQGNMGPPGGRPGMNISLSSPPMGAPPMGMNGMPSSPLPPSPVFSAKAAPVGGLGARPALSMPAAAPLPPGRVQDSFSLTTPRSTRTGSIPEDPQTAGLPRPLVSPRPSSRPAPVQTARGGSRLAAQGKELAMSGNGSKSPPTNEPHGFEPMTPSKGSLELRLTQFYKGACRLIELVPIVLCRFTM